MRASSTYAPSFNHCQPTMTTLESLSSLATTGSSLGVYLGLDPTCTQGSVSFLLCHYYPSSSGLPNVLAVFDALQSLCSVGRSHQI